MTWQAAPSHTQERVAAWIALRDIFSPKSRCELERRGCLLSTDIRACSLRAVLAYSEIPFAASKTCIMCSSSGFDKQTGLNCSLRQGSSPLRGPELEGHDASTTGPCWCVAPDSLSAPTPDPPLATARSDEARVRRVCKFAATTASSGNDSEGNLSNINHVSVANSIPLSIRSIVLADVFCGRQGCRYKKQPHRRDRLCARVFLPAAAGPVSKLAKPPDAACVIPMRPR